MSLTVFPRELGELFGEDIIEHYSEKPEVLEEKLLLLDNIAIKYNKKMLLQKYHNDNYKFGILYLLFITFNGVFCDFEHDVFLQFVQNFCPFCIAFCLFDRLKETQSKINHFSKIVVKRIKFTLNYKKTFKAFLFPQ